MLEVEPTGQRGHAATGSVICWIACVSQRYCWSYYLLLPVSFVLLAYYLEYHIKITCPNFTIFSVHVTRGCRLWYLIELFD